jgi:hypothetical protein
MLNKQAFAKIDMDIKKMKSDVYNMFENFDYKQRMQMDNIKYVLEHSGSKRLNRMSKRLLGKRIENEKIEIGRRSQARPEGQIQTEQLQQQNAKYAKPTNQQIEEARREIKRKTIAANKKYITVNGESEEEYSQKNDKDPKERRISVLDRKDLQPVSNENKKGSNYLKPDDFPLKIPHNQPMDIDNATEIDHLKRNLSPNRTRSYFEDENFIPKNLNNPRRNGKFFYD